MIELSVRVRCCVAALVAVVLFAATAAEAVAPRAPGGRVIWDDQGVPHVFGPNLDAALAGFGFAQMSLQAETILLKVAMARGRAAEYLGPGPGNVYLENDTYVATRGIPDRAERWLSEGGVSQRRHIEAFVAGENEFAARHGSSIAPALQAVLPLRASDVAALIQLEVTYRFTESISNVPSLLAQWRRENGGQLSIGVDRPMLGSNAWALAPSKMAAGRAVLLANPHLPFANVPVPGAGAPLNTWVAAHLVVGPPGSPELDVTGATFPGLPFMAIAFNERLGWTHTVNTIKNADLFEVELNGDRYRFDGRWISLERTIRVIRVREANGRITERRIEVLSTRHGPLIARRGSKAIALRVAGLNAPRMVDQYLAMMSAHDRTTFVRAVAMMQLPVFNIVYADGGGHVMFMAGGLQPRRSGGTWRDWSGILPGEVRTDLWTTYLPLRTLPQVVDPPGGFVQNANDPPWSATFPRVLRQLDYPAYISPDYMGFRAQHATQFLTSKPSFTIDDLVLGRESTHLLLADRVLPDLLAASRASKDPVVAEAAGVLDAWDRSTEPGSRGALLFEAWARRYAVGGPRSTTLPGYPAFRIEWSAEDPIATPLGLRDPARAVAALAAAAIQIKAGGDALDTEWGARRRVRLEAGSAERPVVDVAAAGGDDSFGPIRVLRFAQDLGARTQHVVAGEGYVQLVEFSPTGARAWWRLSYGNDSRAGALGLSRQQEADQSRRLLPAYRSLADIRSHAVAEEAYGALAAIRQTSTTAQGALWTP